MLALESAPVTFKQLSASLWGPFCGTPFLGISQELLVSLLKRSAGKLSLSLY